MLSTDAEASRSSHRWLIAALLAALLACYLFTLRPGHSWGGDFALYILHARNLAEGKQYNDTPYVYNPSFSTHSPQSYPPVFPLLLAPVYRTFGLNYYALKFVPLISHALSVWFLYLLSRQRLPFPAALAITAVAGLNPNFWAMRDEVLPDFTYTAFSLAALAWMDSAYTKGWDRTRPTATAAIAALLFGLAYGTRSVGLTLAPAIFLHDLWRTRGLRRFNLAFSLFCVLSVLTLSSLISSDRFYLQQLRLLSFATLGNNLLDYTRSFAHLWAAGRLRPFEYILSLVSMAGFAWHWRHRLRHLDAVNLYFVFYLALLLVWPSISGIRYILPVIPLFILLSVHGWLLLAPRLLPSRTARHAGIALLAAIALAYATAYRSSSSGHIEGVTEPEFTSLTHYIQQNTDPSGLIYFWNPRVLALYTGHQSASYAPSADPAANWTFFLSRHGRYIVLSKENDQDSRHLAPLIEMHAERMQLVYDNPRYSLFAVKPSHQ